MKYLSSKSLRKILFESIEELVQNKASYVRNPTDHSRTRKLCKW